jgi:hypothetical protein
MVKRMSAHAVPNDPRESAAEVTAPLGPASQRCGGWQAAG